LHFQVKADISEVFLSFFILFKAIVVFLGIRISKFQRLKSLILLKRRLPFMFHHNRLFLFPSLRFLGFLFLGKVLRFSSSRLRLRFTATRRFIYEDADDGDVWLNWLPFWTLFTFLFLAFHVYCDLFYWSLVSISNGGKPLRRRWCHTFLPSLHHLKRLDYILFHN
jgi:hypothetical protein